MGIIKLATPGPGFAALQRIGLAGKALEQHAGSSWLKDAAKTVAKPGISEISGLERKILPTRLNFLNGKNGGQVTESVTGAGKFTTPYNMIKKVASEKIIKLPVSHIKEDGQEFTEVEALSNKIHKIIENMKKEDKEAMK